MDLEMLPQEGLQLWLSGLHPICILEAPLPLDLPKTAIRSLGEGRSYLINQSVIIWTPKIKSLAPSLYPPGQRPSWAGGKREELSLFGKEGRGEIL